MLISRYYLSWNCGLVVKFLSWRTTGVVSSRWNLLLLSQCLLEVVALYYVIRWVRAVVLQYHARKCITINSLKVAMRLQPIHLITTRRYIQKVVFFFCFAFLSESNEVFLLWSISPILSCHLLPYPRSASHCQCEVPWCHNSTDKLWYFGIPDWTFWLFWHWSLYNSIDR